MNKFFVSIHGQSSKNPEIPNNRQYAHVFSLLKSFLFLLSTVLNHHDRLLHVEKFSHRFTVCGLKLFIPSSRSSLFSFRWMYSNGQFSYHPFSRDETSSIYECHFLRKVLHIVYYIIILVILNLLYTFLSRLSKTLC